MPKIGIISTIAFRSDFELAFQHGLKNAAQYDVSDEQNTNAKLAGSLGNFDVPGTYDLIVTVGGLRCAEYVYQNGANVPFISLLGGTLSPAFPGAIQGRFYGGITLRSFDANYDRFFHLTGDDNMGAPKTFDPAAICLLANPDSPLYAAETGIWPNPNAIIGANSLAALTPAFAQFQNTVALQAMIVSADPLFQENRSDLIDLANYSGKYVCYPFQDYANKNTGHEPKKKMHTLHGPSLVNAHFKLGQKAAWVLTLGASRLDPVPIEIHDPQ
jgi:hypothetical protein